MGAIPDVCVGGTPIPLTQGQPAGGIYLINGAPALSLDPGALGIGAHPVTYLFTSTSTGCSDTASTVVQVTNSISVATTNLDSICSGDAAFTLNQGQPVGGIYSGPGVVNDTVFDPALAGSGVLDVIYDYAQNGCSGTDTFTITVDTTPQVSLQPFNAVCINGTPITLSNGSPIGGTYSGPGVNGGVFDPAITGLGQFNIQYTVTNGHCVGTAVESIQVSDGLAEILNAPEQVCENEPPLTLQGNPSGGTFAGPGVSGGVLTPSQLPVGQHQISYAVSNGLCPDTSFHTFTVQPAPVISPITGPLTVQGTVSYTYLINPTNGSSYQWTVNGGTINFTTNNAVNVSWGNGPVGVIGVVETNQYGCSDSLAVQVNIWPLGTDLPLTEGAWSVYPNPVHGDLFIAGPTSVNYDLHIVGVAGNTVYHGRVNGNGSTVISTSNWSAGTYFVRVTSQQHSFVRKLIVH